MDAVDCACCCCCCCWSDRSTPPPAGRNDLECIGGVVRAWSLGRAGGLSGLSCGSMSGEGVPSPDPPTLADAAATARCTAAGLLGAVPLGDRS